ncbi:MAG: formimidoylglutamase [Anaerolineae bacterium]|nr:formimidoylglutamase [Anaerolineae bacterium]
MIFDVFANTHRPDRGFFFRHSDPNDVRLGAVVSGDPAQYEQASIVLLGCPQDEGVRRNGGRPGARFAPDAIRQCLYRLVPPRAANGESPRLFDLGNTTIQPDLETTHELHRQIVRQIIRDGKQVIVLGGGNDLSYPDCAGLAAERPDLLAFNVDAHFDVRDSSVRHSGTPYRQLLEDAHIRPQHFYEVGSQPFANAPIYRQYLNEKGVHVCDLETLRGTGLSAFFENALSKSSVQAIFWGIDLDSVRVADAPGVSAPNPLGLTGAELCQITRIAGRDPRSRIIEFTEVNPEYDIDQRTCRLAAAAIFYFLLGTLKCEAN